MAYDNQPSHGVQVAQGVGDGDAIPPQVQPDVVGERPGFRFKDLTGNEETLKRVRAMAAGKLTQYESDRSDLEERWKDADYMWACGINTTKRGTDQTDDTRADCGDGIFFRQIRTLASQDLAILFSGPDMFTIVPPENPNVEMSDEAFNEMANQRNMLAHYTRKQDDLDRKMFDLMFSRRIYGNQLLICTWDKQVKSVIQKTPTGEHDKNGNPMFKWERKDVVVKDCPSLTAWPIEDAYLDRFIGDIQRQNCIVLASLADSSLLHSRAAAGEYSGIDKVTKAHFWDGTTRVSTEGEADLRETQMANRGEDNTADDSRTGQFRIFDVWIKVPINDDGEWDDHVAPQWHWFTFVHSIRTGPCIRAQDNPDPDGEFPGFMDHVYPDAVDLAYHIGDSVIVKPSFDEKVTRKNQLYDNLHLMNNRPLVAVQGAVFSADLTYSQEKVLWVEHQDALREMDVKDTSGSALPILQYTDDDLNGTVGTDRPIVGEPLGSRTSATESERVYQNASKPHLMLAKYNFLGGLAWYARKFMRLWDVFGDPDRIIRVTREKVKYEVRVGDLFGNFDVEVKLVDEFEESQVQNQNLSFIIQTVIPNFMDQIEKKPFLKAIFKRFKFDPTEFLKMHEDVDAAYFARLRIEAMMEEGTYDPPRPDENLEAHLRETEGYLAQFRGIDISPENVSEDPRLVNLPLVEQYAEELKFLIKQRGQQSGLQVGLGPQNQSEGEAAGNAIAARNPMSNVGGLPIAG